MALILGVSGCDRNEVKVYRLAKENSPSASGGMAAAGQETAGRPRLTWTLPDGWKETPPSEMRVASFTVAGKGGQTADVSVIPLPTGGSELDLVNMWRQQMRLAPLAGGSAAPAEPVTIGSDSGKLFDIASQDPILEGKQRERILVAMVTRGDMSWFFKMTGEASLVRDEKPVFVQFLKSVSIPAGAPAAEPVQFSDAHRFLSTNAKDTPSETSDQPIWVVPPGWQEAPPSQFLTAKFEIGSGEAKADVNVSMLAGAGGGVPMNVNRWRRQLGLEPLEEDAVTRQAASLDADGGKALLVDMTGTDAKTGQPARLVGAIVPQPGQTWFYKLMGNPQTVEQQKDTFTQFVQTVKYPNAH